ncbi:MAG: M23 family metallopeptidase [Candidatus Protistobacter heckmanni]|nr:M23 family metallopeptidase [Candidatus Protistobacter heckmanni]
MRAQKITLAIDGYSELLQRAIAARAAGPAVMAVKNAPMSSNYGLREDPFTGQPAFHSGIDWVSPVGTPVYAVADGVVVSIGPASDFGNMVEVRHGDHTLAHYAHLQVIEVTTGMPVIAGQRIARVGSTGRYTGTQLHFEILIDGQRVNPAPFFTQLNAQRQQ